MARMWLTRVIPFVFVPLLAAAPSQTSGDHVGTRAFALLCAKHGVPVGVVSPPVVMAWRPAEYASEPQFDHDSPFGIGLGRTLSEFNRRNGFCRATQDGMVVHVRAADEPPEVASALETQALFRSDLDGPAGSFLTIAATAIRGGELQGFTGSGPMPPPDSPIQKRVVLPKGSYSALDILDEVARQATGVVWFVTYHPTAGGTRLWIGLMDPTGQTLRLFIDE